MTVEERIKEISDEAFEVSYNTFGCFNGGT